MLTHKESAQTDGYTSGRGVPVAYGSGSSQNLEPPVIVDEEMSAEEITDSYPQSSAKSEENHLVVEFQ